MNAWANALGFVALGAAGAAALSLGIGADAVPQGWGIAEAWRRFARPVGQDGRDRLRGWLHALLPSQLSPLGLADDRIQSTPVTLHEVTTQDGVALEVHLEVLWRRQAPAQRRGTTPCASLSSCQALIPEAAEAVVRAAFRALSLADFLQDRSIPGAAMGLALRLSLRPQGIWVDIVELQQVRPPTGRQAASDAHACVALRLLRAVRRRVGPSSAIALR